EQRCNDDGLVDLVDVELVEDDTVERGELLREGGGSAGFLVIEEPGDVEADQGYEHGDGGQADFEWIVWDVGAPCRGAGLGKVLYFIAAAKGEGDGDPGSDEREQGEDHEWCGHDEWGLVNTVAVVSMPGVVCMIFSVVLLEALFAPEGLEPEAEHVEGGHA